MQPTFTIPAISEPEANLLVEGIDLLVKKKGVAVVMPLAMLMQKLQNAQPFVEPVVEPEPEPAPASTADDARAVGATLKRNPRKAPNNEHHRHP